MMLFLMCQYSDSRSLSVLITVVRSATCAMYGGEAFRFALTKKCSYEGEKTIINIESRNVKHVIFSRIVSYLAFSCFKAHSRCHHYAVFVLCNSFYEHVSY